MPLLTAGSTLAQTYNGTTVLELKEWRKCNMLVVHEGICSKDVEETKSHRPPHFLHTYCDWMMALAMLKQNLWSTHMPTL